MFSIKSFLLVIVVVGKETVRIGKDIENILPFLCATNERYVWPCSPCERDCYGYWEPECNGEPFACNPPGCVCDLSEGFVRNSDGYCIPIENCNVCPPGFCPPQQYCLMMISPDCMPPACPGNPQCFPFGVTPF